MAKNRVAPLPRPFPQLPRDALRRLERYATSPLVAVFTTHRMMTTFVVRAKGVEKLSDTQLLSVPRFAACVDDALFAMCFIELPGDILFVDALTSTLRASVSISPDAALCTCAIPPHHVFVALSAGGEAVIDMRNWTVTSKRGGHVATSCARHGDGIFAFVPSLRAITRAPVNDVMQGKGVWRAVVTVPDGVGAGAKFEIGAKDELLLRGMRVDEKPTSATFATYELQRAEAWEVRRRSLTIRFRYRGALQSVRILNVMPGEELTLCVLGWTRDSDTQNAFCIHPPPTPMGIQPHIMPYALAVAQAMPRDWRMDEEHIGSAALCVMASTLAAAIVFIILYSIG